ncbi:Hypothetical predicted protein [Lecanosticta acicola]|uniref:Uncharacterized protein n=1 Tax=Lecanosticta acicola TaxID=111012 RepID=A0AAI8W129_9PEZI|nr:Hypothetical predicted protein [Lecanosticta acicola]
MGDVSRSDDAIQSFLDTFEQSRPSASHHIPDARVSCCCGNPDCAYLKHSQSALDGLERSVHDAASLGKALLVRHEAYIADSERERKAMTAQIEELESEKQTLEKKNATAIEENRNLLDQLETLNNTVTESDAQVINLQATLRSTQQELHRLSGLAARTERLEQQLAEFEREQASWHATIEEKESSEKFAIKRWQQAERTLSGLQEEMERIEREAKEEKERHVEVIQRMERKYAVEKELDSAAGRLKGAAALKSGANDSSSPNVVSHFVKDILQDNANLQMGIVELRDMLQTSNEEVETLRKQLSVHQPIVEEADIAQPTPQPTRPHLKEEMRRATASELHVHHHYHAPPATQKTNTVRRSRSKKKRYGSLSGHYTPSSGTSTPRDSYPYGTPSTIAAILSQTAASLPDTVSKRSSLQSNHTYQSMRDSSGPSSPISTHRASSLFDRVFSDPGQESSRPTTPDTEDPGSPVWAPAHSKRASKSSYHSRHASFSSHRNRPSLDSILDMSSEDLRQLDQQQTSEAVIPEEDEQDWENTSSPSPDREFSATTSPFSEDLDLTPQQRPRPPIRRATSHESILSFSGMDIHTLKSRPSQLLTPYSGSYTPQAVISDATAHAARPAALSKPTNSGQRLLSGIAPSQRRANGQDPSGKQGLGSKVGGWVFGRWGASPAPVAITDSATVAAPKMGRSVSVASGSTDKSGDSQTPKKPPKHRPPGINQTGPIIGFAPEIKVQHPPIMNKFDLDAMKKVLGDEQ